MAGEAVGVQAIWALSDALLLAELEVVSRVERAAAVRRLALLAEMIGRGVPAQHGFASKGRWVEALLQCGSASSWMMSLAVALPAFPLVGKALADGDVSEAQASAIVKVLGSLDKQPQDIRNEAQEILLT